MIPQDCLVGTSLSRQTRIGDFLSGIGIYETAVYDMHASEFPSTSEHKNIATKTTDILPNQFIRGPRDKEQ